MNEQPRARLVAYGVAVLAPTVTLLVRWPLDVVLGDRVLYMTFFPAVLLAAYFGGFWPGLLATVVSGLAATYFLVEPLFSLEITTVHDAVAVSLFVLVGTVISGLCESLHRSRRRILASERQRADGALSQERHLLRTLMDNLPDLIYFKDLDSRFLCINKALTTYFGLNDPAQAIGRTDFEFFTQGHTQLAVADEREIIRTGRPLVGMEERRVWLDGRVRWLSTTKMPFRDRDGSIVGTFGVSRDITERKRADEALRESELRWRSLAEALPQLVWTDTPDGSCDYLSTQWEKYTGVPAAEHLGSRWMEAIHPDDRERVRYCWTEAVAGRADYDVEFRIRRADGEYRWFKARGVPVRDSAGEIVKWFGTCTDISDLRQTEEALRQANARLDLAVRGSNLSIWECDMPDGRIENSRLTFINVWELLGYDAGTSPADFPSTFALLFHPDDEERVGRQLQELFAGDGQEYESAYRVRPRDGSTRWHLARGRVLRDPKGKPVRFIGTSTDITDLKRAEEALRESERRFRTFVDHATDAFFLFDDQHVILDVNLQACRSLGYAREELLGMTPLDFDPDVDCDRLEELKRMLDDGQSMAFESRHRRKDGVVFPVEIRGQVFREGGRRFAVTLARDVTERKRLEEEVRLATARLELAVRGSNIGIWDIDMPDGDLRNGRVYYLNVWEQLGFERPDAPNDQETGMALVHPDDRVAHAEAARRYLTGETREFEVESRVCRKDGSYRWMLSRGVAVRDAGGKAIRFLGTSIDITDRKRAGEALRESEERFRGTFENAAVGIAHEDLGGRFLRLNGRFCAILGYPPEELVGKTLSDVTHPEDLAADLANFGALTRGESSCYAMEKRFLRKDGTLVWAQLTVSLQFDPVGKPSYCIKVIQDITERKRLDEELRRAKDAAEAANRAKDDFLANVSHEIRTPMNAILGMTELVLDTPLDEGQRQGLKTVKSAADSLLGIINDLLDFSKIEAGKLELVPADFSLRGAVGDTLRALAVRAHKKGLELIYQVQPDVPDALIGDAGRLRQVLLNLAGNAVKFTDEGEVLVRIERMNRTDPVHPSASLLPPSEIGLRFTVLDTGIGIPPDQQERIFQAFEQEDTSTTRKYGGTGLGLTIAARLVALMGGTITVDSAPGRGSTFAFTVSFGPQPHPPESVPPPSTVLLHDLPVLVVDDNATNRHILTEWLRGWQMKPTAVGDGMAAMDALWHRVANGRPYALVLLDARMPDADGLAVAAMIRERAELAATRIILLTSGERPGDPARFRELQIDAQLLKPVQQDELLETIYRVMSRTKERMKDEGGRMKEGKKSASGSNSSFILHPSSFRLRILVAEDNELSAQVLEQSLARQGHRVRLAGNGREVLTLAEQGGFDLLLLDVHMPELDGFQVVLAIRERESTTGGHLPIIALTARSRKEDRERCLAAGMDDFQTKPIRPADLLAAIDRVLRRDEGRGMRDEGRPVQPLSSLIPPPVSLLSPPVLLAACGGDPIMLGKMCRTLTARVPEHLAALRDALRDQDAPRLREAAHKCCGMLSEFSTVAGDLAGSLEDLAAGTQLDKAAPILEQLETIAHELVKQMDRMTVEALCRQAERMDEP
jgi:two-component system, sensor histidine kinase and response regulator